MGLVNYVRVNFCAESGRSRNQRINQLSCRNSCECLELAKSLTSQGLCDENSAAHSS
jgi:hypothetical protein